MYLFKFITNATFYWIHDNEALKIGNYINAELLSIYSVVTILQKLTKSIFQPKY